MAIMKPKLVKKVSLGQFRVFSEQIKRGIVKDIENGKCSVSQASKELSVSSTSIYNWIERYSRYLQHNKRLVVEDKSEAYQTEQLRKRILELEAALGRKQLELDLINKVVDLASEEYKTDLKKSFLKVASNGSGLPKDQDIPTK
jgi:transposase-like protein